MGRAATDQAQWNFQEEANHWRRRVSIFHGSGRQIYAPATQEGRRRATDYFALMDA